MKRFRSGLAAALALAILDPSTAIAQVAPPFMIPDGTPVRLRLNRNLSSGEARVGDTVDFELVEDVKVNDVLVAARGATALATITEAKARGRMGKSGKLDVNIDYMRLVNGDKVNLRAVRESQGAGSTGKMTGAMVATSIVFFPAAPLFLFMKGKDVTIPKGTEITGFVHGDIKLDPNKFVAGGAPAPSYNAPVQTSTAPPARPAAGGKAMTNADVLALKAANFSDDLIMSKIRSSPGDYKLDTGDLLELKKARVTDAVIQAMLEKK